eukprot:scaffold156109_cov35-Tisochrysis_lutea.AAC.1
MSGLYATAFCPVVRLGGCLWPAAGEKPTRRCRPSFILSAGRRKWVREKRAWCCSKLLASAAPVASALPH